MAETNRKLIHKVEELENIYVTYICENCGKKKVLPVWSMYTDGFPICECDEEMVAICEDDDEFDVNINLYSQIDPLD